VDKLLEKVNFTHRVSADQRSKLNCSDDNIQVRLMYIILKT